MACGRTICAVHAAAPADRGGSISIHFWPWIVARSRMLPSPVLAGVDAILGELGGAANRADHGMTGNSAGMRQAERRPQSGARLTSGLSTRNHKSLVRLIAEP